MLFRCGSDIFTTSTKAFLVFFTFVFGMVNLIEFEMELGFRKRVQIFV